jgi:DNA topoisomerase-3
MNRSDVDVIINACDSGREGELIFRHVYEHSACNKKTLRLWISSLEEAAIRTGYENLKDGREYNNLYAAAYCRERADWLVGINCTRAMSVLYGSTLNTGRVQSPTLAMLVKREADIESFIKAPFYTPMIELIGFSASGDKLNDKKDAETVRTACDGKTALINSVERQKKTAAPPKLFDLTLLQREANRLFRFTAQQTLDYAQSLYEKTLISYPRSDSNYLTSDMIAPVKALATWIEENVGYKDIAGTEPDIERLINDKKVSDHHAIIPTVAIMKADLQALPLGESDLLSLLFYRLLCAVASVHVYETATVIFDCEGYSFVAKGKTVIEEGWKEIERSYKDSLKMKLDQDGEDDCDSLPALSKGQVFDNIIATVKAGSTTPPKRYTDDTLLSGMETAGVEVLPDDIEIERKGLGTSATRAAIIEKIIHTGCVERNKKNLVTTDKGRNLVAVLPDALISAELTAKWEHMLKQVELGELTGDDFMNRIADFTKNIIKENNTPIPAYAGLFSNVKPVSEALGVCPRCGAPVREGTKGYFCDTRTCGFKMWKESKFWTLKKKPLTAKIVTALLKEGKVTVNGLYSEKTGKKYDAVVMLDDCGDGFVNYMLEF